MKAQNMTEAVGDVLIERQRQVTTENFSLAHDDRHITGQLAKAGACYALKGFSIVGIGRADQIDDLVEALFPWSPDWWKPKDDRQNLVRAAALLIAEIERLDRLSPRKAPPASFLTDAELEDELARRGLTPFFSRHDSPFNTISGNRQNAEAAAKRAERRRTKQIDDLIRPVAEFLEIDGVRYVRETSAATPKPRAPGSGALD